MNDPYFFLWAILFIVAISGTFDRWRKPARVWILLSEKKFWSVVAREEHPLVILTTRGFLPKRVCFLYPHHGVFFFTWSRPEELPKGVTLVTVGEELA
ncbi:MAG: hypothetical protein ABJF10_17650 [Chthoniobacter sp.]|uniref:hypothetical protein n=1 Tax=Chthoniobacter sp. TaxID=2510640 RepID=UPI0032A609CE